ncbi:Thioredoxin domain-containing protein [Mycena kentingensis (nom. inval.)]|nr:Thioredoxin domain-containing protein [Mycena kentingensis (nom. inval.)]
MSRSSSRLSPSFFIPRSELVIPPRKTKPAPVDVVIENNEGAGDAAAPATGTTDSSESVHVHQINDLEELKTFIAAAELKGTVINFGSTHGCPGCQVIKPYWHKLAAEFADRVNFVHCNLADGIEIGKCYDVRAMPTFVFLKGGIEIQRVVGSNKPKLLDGVHRLAGKRRNSGGL